MASLKERAKKRLTDWLVAERGPVSLPLFDFDQVCQSLRPGDVLLVEGRSRVGTIIRHITHSPWTHAALYIGRISEIQVPELRRRVLQEYRGPFHAPLMVESLLGEGTIIAPVAKYQTNHLRVCRPVGLAEADRWEVISQLVNRIGTRYDTRELLESARLHLLPGRPPSYFRRKVHKGESGNICSSMLGQAFMSVGFPVLPEVEHTRDGKRRHGIRAFQMLAPRDFDHSPSFEIVKCPVDERLCQALLRAGSEPEPPAPPERPSRKLLAGWTLPRLLRRKRHPVPGEPPVAGADPEHPTSR